MNNIKQKLVVPIIFGVLVFAAAVSVQAAEVVYDDADSCTEAQLTEIQSLDTKGKIIMDYSCGVKKALLTYDNSTMEVYDFTTGVFTAA